MPDNTQLDSEHRVIRFPGSAHVRPHARPQTTQPIDDLRKFEQTTEADDYRHRMKTNLAVGIIALFLIFSGLWLADSLTKMRKDQDCVLSGRRGCTPVDVPIAPR